VFLSFVGFYSFFSFDVFGSLFVNFAFFLPTSLQTLHLYAHGVCLFLFFIPHFCIFILYRHISCSLCLLFTWILPSSPPLKVLLISYSAISSLHFSMIEQKTRWICLCVSICELVNHVTSVHCVFSEGDQTLAVVALERRIFLRMNAHWFELKMYSFLVSPHRSQLRFCFSQANF
jgi:hypothetical protein